MSSYKQSLKHHIAGRVSRATRPLNIILERASSFAGISIFIQHHDSDKTSPTDGSVEAHAWSDGKRINYTKSFEDLPMVEQIGIVVHHLLHIALCHVQRGRRLRRLMGSRFDLKIYVLASDLVINDNIGRGHSTWVKGPEPTLSHALSAYDDWCKKTGREIKKHPPQNQWSSEDVYFLLKHWVDETINDMPQWLKDALEAIAVDMDLDSGVEGKDANSAGQADADEIRQWRHRLDRAAAGDKPNGMLREISRDLPEVKTPWNVILRCDMARALRFQPSLDFNKPSRDWIALSNTFPNQDIAFEPARNRMSKAPRISVLIDTSGSIDKDTLDMFAAEINQIHRATKSRLQLVVCDAAVHEVAEIRHGGVKDACRKIQFKGGGGTDFRPAFKAAEDFDPDIIVFLTDMMGVFPDKAPKCPVIWALIPMGAMEKPKAPFGKIIDLE